jgi:hypothetical protein
VTDDEKIVRAAVAIWETFARKSGRGRPWSAVPDRTKLQYRAEARAALLAVGVIGHGKTIDDHGRRDA